MNETSEIIPPETKELEEDDIRSLLSRYLNHIVTQENQEFPLFINILRPQTQWQEKLHHVVAFTVRKSRVNKRALLLKVRTVKATKFSTVSWRRAIHKKPRKSQCTDEKRNLISAMRQAVRFQINKWRRSNIHNKRCALCQSILQLEVDHETPLFSELTSTFLSTVDPAFVPAEFAYSGKTCARKFRKQDALFSGKWKAFHKTNAKLRWLCKPCNLARKRSKRE